MEQHRYEINLKQGDLFINLSSDDLYFISKQMDKWCQVLMDDSYIPISVPASRPTVAHEPAGPIPESPSPAPAPQPVYEAPPQPVYAPPQSQTTPEPYMQPQAPVYAPPPQTYPTEAPQYEQPAYTTPPAPQPAPAYSQPVPQPQQMQPAPQAAPIATGLEMPGMEAPTFPSPTPAPSAPAPKKDEFEDVMDSLMREFEDDSPAAERTPSYAVPGIHDPIAAKVPNLSGASTLLELCDRAHAESSEDYLLLSAYFLTQFEREEKFSLKRINSMLVKSGLTPVNHSVLEAILSRGYLSMVPDMTGMAEVSEYILTAEGQSAIMQLF